MEKEDYNPNAIEIERSSFWNFGTFPIIFLYTIEFYLDFSSVLLFIYHMNLVKRLGLWQNDTYILVLYENPVN